MSNKVAEISVIHGKFGVLINAGAIVPDVIRDDIGLVSNVVRCPVIYDTPITFGEDGVPLLAYIKRGSRKTTFVNIRPGDEVSKYLGIVRYEEDQNTQ